VAHPAPRVCCLDLDTFFVSVERLLDPSLVGRPVVVGAAPGNRGVVCACSYEVRRFGVRSGMPISEAVRLAPHAVFLPPRHATYSPYAKEVRTILERYTPEVQTASIDEFFLDFRGCERLYASRADADDDATVERVVRRMRQDIQAELGLPASAGVGVTRSIAKIASGRAKPAGVVMVRRGEERDFLRPLPVRKFPGIGPVSAACTKPGFAPWATSSSCPTGPLARASGASGIGSRQRVTPVGSCVWARTGRPSTSSIPKVGPWGASPTSAPSRWTSATKPGSTPSS